MVSSGSASNERSKTLSAFATSGRDSCRSKARFPEPSEAVGSPSGVGQGRGEVRQ